MPSTKCLLCETCANGDVDIIRTDGGTAFQEDFQPTCNRQRVKPKTTLLANSPCFIDCTDRGLAVIVAMSRAARVHRNNIFHGLGLPENANCLLSEAMHWTGYALDMYFPQPDPY